ncbi:MAG: GAF domain-containing protein [Gammaproteobacteria bacterium]|nr:GAF domain-containing protein [Gammaproteobacteria bacterium]
MLVRFWGTRGSLAKPHRNAMRYGGNTSCVEVRSNAGTLVVLDCGTGAHDLGQALVEETDGALGGHMLISHTHWDHIQGIPFFTPFFSPDCSWDIYAPHNLNQSIEETLSGQMVYTYFPVTLHSLGATIRYHDLVEGTFQIEDMTVRTRYLNHPALTLGYRLEVDGVAVVYACDHEQYPRGHDEGLGAQNARHVEFLRGADLVIHDAQYMDAEYDEKSGWGHSTAEYAVEVCLAAGVKQLALTHHDPLRTDDAVDEIVGNLSKKLLNDGESLRVIGAAEGQTIRFDSRAAAATDNDSQWFPAAVAIAPAMSEHSILLCSADNHISGQVSAAAAAEGIHLDTAVDQAQAVQAIEDHSQSLVVIDESLGHAQALKVCRKVREQGSRSTPQAPIVLLANSNYTPVELAELCTDRIVRPFSQEYLRTRLRTWVLRTTCRWVRARLPDNEAARLEALHDLNILDTATEERFDRIVRSVAEALDVPIALVSLVDSERQWFKAHLGLEARETPRDMAFCAHAILDDDVMVVPDTFLDSRFADNPLVTGDQRIRFYAGCPLRLPNGHVMGTLCLIDSRPRQLDGGQISVLKEHARMAEAELVNKPSAD